MGMNCGEVEAKLLGLLDGSLDDADKALVAEHLGACRHCRAKHDQMSTADHFLRSELPQAAESISAPEFLALRIKHKLTHDNGDWWQSHGTRRMWAAAAAIAIIVLAGISINAVRNRNIKRSSPVLANLNEPNDKPTVVILIVPRHIPEIPRRDDGTLPDTIDDQPPLNDPRNAAAPKIQSPVRVLVKPAQYNPDR